MCKFDSITVTAHRGGATPRTDRPGECGKWNKTARSAVGAASTGGVGRYVKCDLLKKDLSNGVPGLHAAALRCGAAGRARRAEDVKQALLNRPPSPTLRRPPALRPTRIEVGGARRGYYLYFKAVRIERYLVRAVAFYPTHGRARPGPPPPPVIFERAFFKSENAQKGVPGRPRSPWGGPAWPHVHGEDDDDFAGRTVAFLGAPWRASCTEPCRLRAAHPSCV